MRKLTQSLSVIALGVALAACSKPEAPKQENPAPATTSSAPAPAQPNPASAPASQGGLLVEGESYRVASQDPESAKPRVIEFFSYACPHCFRMEPFMKDWQAKKPHSIELERVPVVFHEQWAIYAKAYYVGEELGLLDKSHEALFVRLHEDNKPFESEDDMVQFFVGLGAQKEAVEAVLKGPRLAERLAYASEQAAKFQIQSTPSFVVNNKYYTDGAMGKERLGEVLDALALRNKPSILN